MSGDRTKLPVFETVGSALSYPAQNYLQILKVMVLPFLLLYGPLLAFLFFRGEDLIGQLIEVTGSIDGPEDLESEAMQEFFVTFNVLSYMGQGISLFYMPLVMVPITRAIVAGEKLGWLHLNRYVGWSILARILFGFILFGVVLVVLLGAALPISIAAAVGAPDGLVAALGVIAALVLIFLLIRLSLYLVDVAVRANLNPMDTFKMTRRNVLRLVGAGILVGFVMIVLSGFVFGALFGIGMGFFGGDFVALAGTDDVDWNQLADLSSRMFNSPVVWILLALGLAANVYFQGVGMAFAAYCYKALAPNLPAPASATEGSATEPESRAMVGDADPADSPEQDLDDDLQARPDPDLDLDLPRDEHGEDLGVDSGGVPRNT